MSNQNQNNAVQDLEQLTDQAVSLAKQRRQRELSEKELADVSGGLAPNGIGGGLTGYDPTGPAGSSPL
jgi:bacteriocin-like protein